MAQLKDFKDKSLKDMEFEKLIGNPATHRSAMEILMKEKARQTLYLRNSSQSKISPFVSEESDSSTLIEVSDQASKLPVPKPMTAEGDEDGELMVREMIRRYETNKIKAIRAGRAEKKGRDELDLEEDEDLVWNEDVNAPIQKSDFLSYVVPQYEVKCGLYKKHTDKIVKMSLMEVTELCRHVISDLQDIMDEKVPCQRHKIFKSCGVSKHTLHSMTIVKPFTRAHDNCVINVINEMLSERNAKELNYDPHYISCVLIPEALVRIYAVANELPKDHAEKELLFGACYDGTLSADLIESLIENDDGKKEDTR